MITSWSSITASSDRGKPYWCLHLLGRLQSILNTAACLIFLCRKIRTHHDLRWLWVPQQIQSRCAFWHSYISMVWCYHTWPTVFVASSVSLVISICTLLTWPCSLSNWCVDFPRGRIKDVAALTDAVKAATSLSTLWTDDIPFLKLLWTLTLTHFNYT